MLALTRELVPPDLPVHALGVGHPVNVVACAQMGYPMFDSAMPTRDARNGRLYAFTTDDPRLISGQNGDWLAYLYVGDDKHIKSDRARFAVLRLPDLHALFARLSASPVQDQRRAVSAAGDDPQPAVYDAVGGVSAGDR